MLKPISSKEQLQQLRYGTARCHDQLVACLLVLVVSTNEMLAVTFDTIVLMLIASLMEFWPFEFSGPPTATFD